MVRFAVLYWSANRAQVYHRYPKGNLIRENLQNRGKRQIWDPQCFCQHVLYIFVIFVAQMIADIELRDRLNRQLPGIVAATMNGPVTDKSIEVLAKTKLIHGLKELILQDAYMTAGRDAERSPKTLQHPHHLLSDGAPRWCQGVVDIKY